MKLKQDIQEIIVGCLQSEHICQRALVDAYSGLLYVICNRYLGDKYAAQDALQECWALIFRKLETYDKQKGKFESWASTLTIRHCLNILAKKRVKLIELTDATVNGVAKDFQKQMISNLSADQLLDLVAMLPDKYRTVFNMSVIDGYSHKEIAEILNITELNSRARLTRAKKILKDKINSQNNKESWVRAI